VFVSFSPCLAKISAFFSFVKYMLTLILLIIFMYENCKNSNQAANIPILF
jgi:hypothetical protein